MHGKLARPMDELKLPNIHSFLTSSSPCHLGVRTVSPTGTTNTMGNQRGGSSKKGNATRLEKGKGRVELEEIVNHDEEEVVFEPLIKKRGPL